MSIGTLHSGVYMLRSIYGCIIYIRICVMKNMVESS